MHNINGRLHKQSRLFLDKMTIFSEINPKIRANVWRGWGV